MSSVFTKSHFVGIYQWQQIDGVHRQVNSISSVGGIFV